MDHPGRVVTKEEVLRTVWPDTVVSEWVLTTCIWQIRKALREEAQAPQYLATVHRRGYRFIAPIAATAPLVQSPRSKVQGQYSAFRNWRRKRKLKRGQGSAAGTDLMLYSLSVKESRAHGTGVEQIF